jgi:hypothetical protein
VEHGRTHHHGLHHRRKLQVDRQALRITEGSLGAVQLATDVGAEQMRLPAVSAGNIDTAQGAAQLPSTQVQPATI